MKKTPFAGALAATLVMCLAAPSAFAWHHGPRVSIGFGFGVPLAPYYYHPAYYYPPYYPAYVAPVIVQRQPTVYVEQQQSAPAAQPSVAANYWYYCADSRAYYPYVKECPAGWQRVAPHPSN